MSQGLQLEAQHYNALDILLRTEPQQLVAAACSAELLRLTSWLHACLTAVEHHSKQYCLSMVADSMNMARDASPVIATKELAMSCLAFADVKDLGRARALSRQWESWAGSDQLWGSLTQARWPSTAALSTASVVKHDFILLYQQRMKLERLWQQGRGHSSAAITMGDGGVQDYALLFELSLHDQEPIIDVLDMSIRDLTYREYGGVLEARAPELCAQLPKPVDIDTLIAGLSIMLIRRCDGRLMCLCNKETRTGHDSGEDGLNFDLDTPDFVPAVVEQVFTVLHHEYPGSTNQVCLDHVRWAQHPSADESGFGLVAGFERIGLRAWSCFEKWPNEYLDAEQMLKLWELGKWV